jgi:hypothetical protein
MGDITPHQKWARDTCEALKTLLQAAELNKISGFVIVFEAVEGDVYEIQTHAAGEFDSLPAVAGSLLGEAIRLVMAEADPDAS